MKDNLPRLWIVLTRDWGAFLATFLGPLAVTAAFALYLLEFLAGETSASEPLDIVLFLLMIPLSSLVLMPAVLWWHYVIRRTFKRGRALEAIVKKTNKKFSINIGVTYSYHEDGREVERIADFVNTRKVKRILAERKLTALVDKKGNISFIKEMFE